MIAERGAGAMAPAPCDGWLALRPLSLRPLALGRAPLFPFRRDARVACPVLAAHRAEGGEAAVVGVGVLDRLAIVDGPRRGACGSGEEEGGGDRGR